MKRLLIVDFDCTLFKTMEPLEGVHIWKEKTGLEWTSLGWWSKSETLNTDIFDITLNDYPHQLFLEHKSQSDAYTALVTGRLSKIKSAVESVLYKHDIKFDEVLCNTGGPTLNFKLREFQRLFDKFKDTLEEVIVIDDRDEHIGSFIEWGLRNQRETGVKINVIHFK